MIGYVTIGSNDIEKARDFYAKLLAEVGAKELMRFGEAFTMYGMDMSKPAVAVTTPYNKAEAAAGNGNMIALVQSSRANVDKLYAKAMELGGSCEGAPGVRGEEGPNAMYFAYFRDPEGNKLAAYKLGPAD